MNDIQTEIQIICRSIKYACETSSRMPYNIVGRDNVALNIIETSLLEELQKKIKDKENATSQRS